MEEYTKSLEAEISVIYAYIPMVMILIDEDRRVRKANAFTERFTNSSAEELIGKRGGEALRCLHHLDDPRGCGFGPHCHRCLVRRTVNETFLQKSGYQKLEASLPFLIDGKEKILTFLLSTSYVDLKNEPLVIVWIEDITAQKEAEAKRDEYQKILTSTIDAIDSLLMVIDRHHRIVLSNWKDHEWVPEEQRDKRPYCYEAMKRYDTPCSYCPPIKTFEDGKPRWYEDRNPVDGSCKEISVIPIFNEKGSVEYVLENVRDIDDRKKTEEKLQKALKDKDYLMKELNHRVKNNLAIITSLINLKSSELKGRVDLSDIAHQIDAIRIVHEKLYQTDDVTHIDFKEYTQDLLNTVFSSFTQNPITIRNGIEHTEVPTKTAVSLGLIINEVATNAVKYGFTSDGESWFSIHLEQDDKPGWHVLTLSNSGPPFPEEVDLEHPHTLGLRLITALVDQLGGTIELRRRPTPQFVIRFPMPE